MSGRLRAALIGCGHIAEFHAPALRAAGVDIVAVSGRRGSTRAHDFARRHEIESVLDGPDAVFDRVHEWDGLVLVPDIPPMLELLGRAIEANIPTLVEKPIAVRSADLASLDVDAPVLVGYNRRYYDTAIEARELVSEAEPTVAQVTLPEAIDVSAGPDYLETWFTNSVHVLDMLLFVFGPLHVATAERLIVDGRIAAIAATMTTGRGDVVQLMARWRASANFAITIDWPGRRYEMRPLERATVYEGMDVVEPTPAVPIRTYAPKAVRAVGLAPEDEQHKPGFLRQAGEFRALLDGQRPTIGAGIRDARAVLELAEALADTEL